MRFFTVLFIILVSFCYVQADEKNVGPVVGSLASLEEGSKNKYTGDDREDLRFGGNILGSLRRTAARLQEYNGIAPTGELAKTTIPEREKILAQGEVRIPEAVENYMLFFTMEGCGGCLTMYPIIKELQQQRYKIYWVYPRKNQKLVRQYKVKSYPTMVIFDGKEVVKKFVGAVATKTITKNLNKPKQSPNNSDHTDYNFVSGLLTYRLW